jgi:hypothetical protein
VLIRSTLACNEEARRYIYDSKISFSGHIVTYDSESDMIPPIRLENTRKAACWRSTTTSCVKLEDSAGLWYLFTR